MKKLMLALTAAAAFTGSAFAADLPARTYSKAPAPIAAVASWTGFWISGGFGYGLMDMDHSVTNSLGSTIFDIGHDNGGRGWLGKVGAGFDYQFMGNFVIGAFADGQFSDIKGNYSFNCPGGCSGPFGFVGQLKNDWSWAAGGRIGYVALPGLLTYVNGGYSQAHFTQVNYLDAALGTATGLVLGSQSRGGYFLGGGTEYAISQIPGLFWKSEYRFADYGNKTNSQLCTVGAVSCGTGGTIHSLDRSHTYEQTATTELVYRFNWGGPVVAKY
ncbi:MAG TPA: porin family protein [Bradyrhizobium sp.]|jgi:outer membrane immunogenic protein